MTCDSFIQRLRQMNIKIVAFDMDQTAVRAHSMGRLRKDEFEGYAKMVSNDFMEVVPVLLEEGFKLAIATHSDVIEYVGDIKPVSHLLGEHLVDRLLSELFPSHVKDNFFVVAYNPRRRLDTTNLGKTYHIHKISDHYKVPHSQIILFDDDEDNIIQTRGLCTAIPVEPKVGFVYSNLLERSE
eukprot:TRINITY_DN13409_c0_g1_i1.p1 TRINITY_DN13409_c0_g1~~TRINITY_DN13409_c0_g1_i1.p1  ORF type:complete len:210 (+),score=32.17 TRINITY_DN13409_c0_g1_i1:84-632(+)